MRVQVGDTNYAIRFNYAEVLRPVAKMGGVQNVPVGRDTFCTIAKVNVDPVDNRAIIADIVALGTATLSREDSYNGPYGRFLAFRRALAQIEDREARRALGRAYSKTVRLPDFRKVNSDAHA